MVLVELSNSLRKVYPKLEKFLQELSDLSEELSGVSEELADVILCVNTKDNTFKQYILRLDQ